CFRSLTVADDFVGLLLNKLVFKGLTAIRFQNLQMGIFKDRPPPTHFRILQSKLVGHCILDFLWPKNDHPILVDLANKVIPVPPVVQEMQCNVLT
ncbi:hypothetical protein U1Q18_029394, partial [Sarracenia purpurea var. burkii]